MKKLSCILCLAISMVFLSCSPVTEEDLYGTWQVTDFESTAELSPVFIKMVSKLALTRTYEFGSDGTFLVNTRGTEEIIEGQWTMTEGLDQLTLKSGQPEVSQVFQVTSFEKRKFVFIDFSGDSGYDTYTLTKN